MTIKLGNITKCDDFYEKKEKHGFKGVMNKKLLFFLSPRRDFVPRQIDVPAHR